MRWLRHHFFARRMEMHNNFDPCGGYHTTYALHLFHKMVNNKDYCIHQLLPSEKILPIKLRATNCTFALFQCHYNLYKRSFVLRYLFGDAY